MSSHTASACVDIEKSGKYLLLNLVISYMCFHMYIVSKTSFILYIKAEITLHLNIPYKRLYRDIWTVVTLSRVTSMP